MINRIIHFSDLHIRLFKDHDLYREILLKAFDEWSLLKPDRIVFTGDLVHSKNQMTPELVDFIRWVLSECSNIAKTILIIGNHDFLENNNSRLDAITPVLNSLDNDRIIFYKESGIYVDENINWCVYSLMNHNLPPDIRYDGNKNIGLFHGPIQGLTTDIGYKFDDGYDTGKFNGCDLVLCGDIHKRQIFNIPNNRKAYMIGSFIQQKFDETVTKHGYGVYEVDADKYTFIDIPNRKPFLSFKIESFSDIFEGSEKLVNT